MAKIKYKNNGGWIELSAADIDAASNNIIVSDTVAPVQSKQIANDTKLYIDNSENADDQGTILRIQTKDIEFPLSYENGGTNASSLAQAKSNLGITDLNIIDLIYPVGSIYISANNTFDPNTVFSPTVWKKISGRFLVGAGDNLATGNENLNLSFNTTGGETKHTLKANESGVPAHTHTTNSAGKHSHTITSKWKAEGGSATSGHAHPNSGGKSTTTGWNTASEAGAHTHTANNNTAKDASEPHNNLPPYFVVNIWQRTD